jgi:phage shock protein C
VTSPVAPDTHSLFFFTPTSDFLMARLRKSTTNRMLAGVLGGIAEHFGWDTTVVRLLFVLLVLFGVGSPILVYIVLAIVMPN